MRVEDPYRTVVLGDGTELNCHALLIATGVSIRRLDVPGIDAVTGAGVYYGAAVTEAVNYKHQHIFVVGAANSAGQGAVFFARYASKVTMLVRGESIENDMSQYLVDQIRATENIEVLVNTEVTEVHGQEKLEAVTIANIKDEETRKVPAAAIFIFIGAVPHTDLVAGVVELNEAGFIPTGHDLFHNGKRPKGWRLGRDPYTLETSVPGIFAAGDVRHDVVRRVATAVGEGAIAVSFVHQYLRTV